MQATFVAMSRSLGLIERPMIGQGPITDVDYLYGKRE